MEFGKVKDLALLNDISWELPGTDPLSAPIFKSELMGQTKVWIGAPAWNHKEWIGKIYPPKSKPTDFLAHYARYFNTIELNASHYRIPTMEQVHKWRDSISTEFVFCPKVYQGLSHDLAGMLDAGLQKVWFDFIASLKENLGPCFFQLPPHFDYSKKAHLFRFLQAWPSEFKLSIELRHPSWFQDKRILPALTQYLQSRNIGLVITDVAGRRDVLHNSLSSDFSLIRFIGNDLHPSDQIRAQIWNQRLEEWKIQGLREVFFFVHEPDDILVPEMTEKIRELSFFKSVSN